MFTKDKKKCLLLLALNLFASLSVIAVGDLYQLPPMPKKSVFEDYKYDALNLYHPWHVFKMTENKR